MPEGIENTFEKGAHQDNELVAQPKGTYRRSVNGKITSRKDGSFAWESIKGNILEFEITVQDYYFDPVTSEWHTHELHTNFVPVGNIEGKDKIFLFFVEDDGSLLIGYVGKETDVGFNIIYYLKNNLGNNGIFGRDIFTFSTEKFITGYSIFENAEIERIYFSNNDLPPLTLNIAPLLIDKTNLYYSEYRELYDEASEFSWIDSGKLARYYMVLSGATYWPDGHLVRPGEIFSIADDNSSYIECSPNLKIIDFYPLQNAEFDPLLNFPSIESTGVIDGYLPCGNYIFAVSYYTRCGHYTNWSPLSQSFGVGKYMITPDPTVIYRSVLDWQRYRGGDFETYSAKGIQLVLKNTETIFHKIRIAAFLVDPANPLTTGKIIAEKEIGKVLYEDILTVPVPTAQVDLTFDFTNYAGADVTISEVMVSTTRLEKIEDLTTALNFAITAGVQEESELNIGSKITGSIRTLIQEIPGDVVNLLSPYQVMLNNDDTFPNYPLTGLYSLDGNGYVKKVTNAHNDNSFGHLLPNQFYEVCEYPVVYPDNSSNYYLPGERFQCNNNSFHSYNYKNYNNATPGFVKPVFPVLKYIDKNDNYIYDWVSLNEQTGLKMTGNQLAGYWGNETYRIGLLPISKSGRPMYVRWIADWDTLERQKGYTATDNCYYVEPLGSIVEPGKLHWTGDLSLVKKYNMAQPVPCDVYRSLQYLYPLVTVDLTDIINDISGFCIVRAPRDKKIISEGFVEPIIKQLIQTNPLGGTAEYGIKVIRTPGFNDGRGVYDFLLEQEDLSDLFVQDQYIYITPEHLFKSDFVFDLNSIVKPVRIFSVISPAVFIEEFGGDETYHTGGHYKIFYRKFYDQQIVTPSFDGEVSVENATAITEGQVELNLDYNFVDFWNIAKSVLTNINTAIDEQYCARASRGLLLLLSLSRNWNELPNPAGAAHDYWSQDSNIMIVQQQKTRVGLYNDTPESFANTDYMTVGHYQKVDQDFKDAILKDGRYIVNDIQLTGGDCYISLFDFTRLLINGNNLYQEDDEPNRYFNFQRGDTIIVPLQTSMNLNSRNNRNSSYYKPSAIEANRGICYTPLTEESEFEVKISSQTGFLENFNYNNSFSNQAGQNLYPGYPLNLSMLNSFLMRLRWGNKKVYGELDDAFRKYPALQFLDVNGFFGKINNIKSNRQYLVYWQDNCVGYIPIQEKVLTSTVAGAYVQLGIGNAFEIYDELGKTYGNRDRLSLLEANEVFTWFDRRNMCVIMMDRTMKLGDKSKVPGIDTLLNNMGLSANTNAFPGINGTVYSYYDYFKKIAYMTFWNTVGRQPVEDNLTIGIDLERGIFHGEFQFYPILAYSADKQLKIAQSDNKVYTHDEISVTLFGETFESFIEIVVTGGFDVFLKFVNMICMGNENFFTKIKFSANFQYDTGLYLNEVEETVDTRNYKRFLDDMRFSIPQGILGRMEGKAMVVRFTNETPLNTVKLLRTSTKIIKLT
ncbi:MAG: hypothetical protein WC222_11350 [Parachlamydiales bacterium]|jgi:hypothetical protein